jgi:hypothetical protein
MNNKNSKNILFIDKCIFDHIRIVVNPQYYFIIIKKNIFYGILPPERYKYIIDNAENRGDAENRGREIIIKDCIIDFLSDNLLSDNNIDENKKKYFGDGINPSLKNCYSSPTAAL